MKIITVAALSLGTMLVAGAASAQEYRGYNGYNRGYNNGYNREYARPVYVQQYPAYAPRAVPVYQGGYGYEGGWNRGEGRGWGGHHWRRGW